MEPSMSGETGRLLLLPLTRLVVCGSKMRYIIVLVISRLDMVMIDEITRKLKVYILT
jgi:hypothetical protein